MTLEGLLLALDSMDEAELNDYRITVHGMKSALNNIGEKKLTYSAIELENAAVDRNFAYLAKQTPVFISKIKRLIDKLES